MNNQEKWDYQQFDQKEESKSMKKTYYNKFKDPQNSNREDKSMQGDFNDHQQFRKNMKQKNFKNEDYDKNRGGEMNQGLGNLNGQSQLYKKPKKKRRDNDFSNQNYEDQDSYHQNQNQNQNYEDNQYEDMNQQEKQQKKIQSNIYSQMQNQQIQSNLPQHKLNANIKENQIQMQHSMNYPNKPTKKNYHHDQQIQQQQQQMQQMQQPQMQLPINYYDKNMYQNFNGMMPRQQFYQQPSYNTNNPNQNKYRNINENPSVKTMKMNYNNPYVNPMFIPGNGMMIPQSDHSSFPIPIEKEYTSDGDDQNSSSNLNMNSMTLPNQNQQKTKGIKKTNNAPTSNMNYNQANQGMKQQNKSNKMDKKELQSPSDTMSMNMNSMNNSFQTSNWSGAPMAMNQSYNQDMFMTKPSMGFVPNAMNDPMFMQNYNRMPINMSGLPMVMEPNHLMSQYPPFGINQLAQGKYQMDDMNNDNHHQMTSLQGTPTGIPNTNPLLNQLNANTIKMSTNINGNPALKQQNNNLNIKGSRSNQVTTNSMPMKYNGINLTFGASQFGSSNNNNSNGNSFNNCNNNSGNNTNVINGNNNYSQMQRMGNSNNNNGINPNLNMNMNNANNSNINCGLNANNINSNNNQIPSMNNKSNITSQHQHHQHQYQQQQLQQQVKKVPFATIKSDKHLNNLYKNSSTNQSNATEDITTPSSIPSSLKPEQTEKKTKKQPQNQSGKSLTKIIPQKNPLRSANSEHITYNGNSNNINNNKKHSSQLQNNTCSCLTVNIKIGDKIESIEVNFNEDILGTAKKYIISHQMNDALILPLYHRISKAIEIASNIFSYSIVRSDIKKMHKLREEYYKQQNETKKKPLNPHSENDNENENDTEHNSNSSSYIIIDTSYQAERPIGIINEVKLTYEEKEETELLNLTH